MIKSLIKQGNNIPVEDITKKKHTSLGNLPWSPKVSIITPTYNHQTYIRQCIESILAQTMTDWEQLIIDDGSTDGTPAVIEEYKDPRIRFFRQEHIGIWRLSETYNKALKLARAGLIAILEGDDFWPPDKLEKQIPLFDDKGVCLTWGIGVNVNADGKPIGKQGDNHTSPSVPRDVRQLTRKLVFRNFVTPSVTVMIRREALLPDGFQQPPRVPFVDYPTWFKLASRGKFYFVDNVLGYWRRHSQQMTVSRMWDMEKGNLATYWNLWQMKQISLPLLIGIVPYSLAKYIRRVIINKL
jgi:glycosyltransferase involved in cell wall biosynthesis